MTSPLSRSQCLSVWSSDNGRRWERGASDLAGKGGRSASGLSDFGQSAKLASDVAAIRGMRDHEYTVSCDYSRFIYRRFATCSG